MDPFAQELDCLVDEIAERRTGVFVAGRDDFDHRDNSAEMVADDDAIGPSGVNLFVRTMNHLSDRRFQGGHAGSIHVQSGPPRPGFDGENVWIAGTGSLFHEGDGPPG